MKRTFVPPSGNPDAKLAICGEQPGLQEIRHIPPTPFVGPAGRGLDECLLMTKIFRRELYLTNVIKDMDMPLAKYINLNSKGKYLISDEGYTYIKELGDELKKLNINCIVALGNIALLALTNRVGITKWRGSVLESTIVPGLKVVPTFHPATFIPPKFNFLNKPLICEDLLRAKHESENKGLHRIPRNVMVRPRFNDCVSALRNAYDKGVRGEVIGVDIEVINREVDCFSVSWSPTEALSIPLRDSKGDYFTPDQELEIIQLLASIIEDERITKIGANFIFDLQFLYNRYGIRPRGVLHCTQIAQKISYPDYPAGLDFVTTMHTDIPYYKADGKQWMKMGMGTWEEWWNYNGMDAIVPVDAFPKQFSVLEKQGNTETYERQRLLIEPLIYMSERGIKIDVEGMEKYKKEQQSTLDDLAWKLNQEVGHEINYNSPKQLADYFYKTCGIRPYKKKNANNDFVDTTDVDALKRIFRRDCEGSQAARLMLDIRSLSKRISTYLNTGKVDNDGRYRSSYKPVGTDTGRLSSGETIFGTGGNQQNWPHDLLKFFRFDEGYIGYSFDISQGENRIVAYVGGIISQIEAFERGIDLHKMTASIIFNKPYDLISSVDGSSTLGDGRQSERYWGKKGNHAINYDVSYKTFALKNELPEAEAKNILDKIHRGYPQIRGGYHVTVQNMLKHNRVVTNLFGRSRTFLGPVVPSGNSVPRAACDATYRAAYAHLPQSTIADKINEQGIEFIYYNQDMFGEIELLTQIHDSIVFQIPLSLDWHRHAWMLSMIKSSLETPLSWHDTDIETPVDLSMGFNMCKEEMIEMKSKEIPDNVDELASRLKEAYNELQTKEGR